MRNRPLEVGQNYLDASKYFPRSLGKGLRIFIVTRFTSIFSSFFHSVQSEVSQIMCFESKQRLQMEYFVYH